MPSECCVLEWCAQRWTRCRQGGRRAEPGFVEVIDGGRGVGICSTTRHSQPAIAATSDPEAFFLGKKVIEAEPSDVVPLHLLAGGESYEWSRVFIIVPLAGVTTGTAPHERLDEVGRSDRWYIYI